MVLPFNAGGPFVQIPCLQTNHHFHATQVFFVSSYTITHLTIFVPINTLIRKCKYLFTCSKQEIDRHPIE